MDNFAQLRDCAYTRDQYAGGWSASQAVAITYIQQHQRAPLAGCGRTCWGYAHVCRNVPNNYPIYPSGDRRRTRVTGFLGNGRGSYDGDGRGAGYGRGYGRGYGDGGEYGHGWGSGDGHGRGDGNCAAGPIYNSAGGGTSDPAWGGLWWT